MNENQSASSKREAGLLNHFNTSFVDSINGKKAWPSVALPA